MTAGLLLTGGAGRRMGVDKAELRRDGERLADRAARVLAAACDPVLEVGPGRSSLERVRESTPGEGPLVALVAGAEALGVRGYDGPVFLLAVDLPFVEPPLLRWLADRPGAGTVVPVAGNEPQPCCARYSTEAVAVAGNLVARGERSLRALLRATPVHLAAEDEWSPVAPITSLDDVDTPADAARLGLDVPNGAADPG
ncbi:MAG TPA: molybdenum cofactor guanylyltransferase [Acidimicrobiia bacterium]